MDSASVPRSKCDIAPSGTAFAVVELVFPADVAPLLDVEVCVAGVRTVGAALSILAAGVYCAALVSAFDPAEVDPLFVEDAAAPTVLAAEFAWIYSLFSLFGS